MTDDHIRKMADAIRVAIGQLGIREEDSECAARAALSALLEDSGVEAGPEPASPLPWRPCFRPAACDPYGGDDVAWIDDMNHNPVDTDEERAVVCYRVNNWPAIIAECAALRARVSDLRIEAEAGESERNRQLRAKLDDVETKCDLALAERSGRTTAAELERIGAREVSINVGKLIDGPGPTRFNDFGANYAEPTLQVLASELRAVAQEWDQAALDHVKLDDLDHVKLDDGGFGIDRDHLAKCRTRAIKCRTRAILLRGSADDLEERGLDRQALQERCSALYFQLVRTQRLLQKTQPASRWTDEERAEYDELVQPEAVAHLSDRKDVLFAKLASLMTPDFMKSLVSNSRLRLQKDVYDWVKACFGETAALPHERALRLLEESIELAQAEGVSGGMAEMLIDHVYRKPPGERAQEVGGVAVTRLAYCASIGIDAETAEFVEIKRVLGADQEKLRARHNAKVDAGVSTARAPTGGKT